MTLLAAAAVLGYVLDAALGEPPLALHPTVWTGRAAARLEAPLRRRCRSLAALRGAGTAAALVLVAAAACLAWVAAAGAARLHPLASAGAAALVLFAAVARRGLARAGEAVRERLEAGDLPGARRRLAEIVGRDTEDLDQPEVVRGAVESVAENACDAVVAPLFWFAAGGLMAGAPGAAALAAAHRAANTLDAVWGYRDDRYRHLGWGAARLDDLLNYLPARLTALLLALAAPLVGLDGRGALRTALRDGRRHPSPNAGYPEAAAAGALGVRLGGVNLYGGHRETRPHLGTPRRPLTPARIAEAVRLADTAALLALAAAVAALARA